ncbi:M20/M25/M40 family metallo-hydrolase [Candidatus Dojkabacteria bacterium]|nr:M20/M25/M40 family metallo-hydrolase [Candidatus Dojkabacteria bacterium]
MNKKAFLAKINQEVNKNNIKDLTIDLCKQNTVNPPGNEELCAPIIENYFDIIGVDSFEKYEKEKNRVNLVASIRGKNMSGSKSLSKTIALVGHTDVVPVEGQDWKTKPFEPVVKDGKIFARGAADNKGPFACVLEGVRVFTQITENQFDGTIMLIAAADEEVGSEKGIKYLFDDIDLDCDYALIPDSGSFSNLVFGEMGIYTLEFYSTGKAYHGSVPEKGINAIIPIANLAEQLYQFDWNSLKGSKEFDHTVINVGKISGGTASNTVPDRARMVAMWRYPLGVRDEQIEDIVKNILNKTNEKYPKVKIKYERRNLSHPYLGEKSNPLIKACFSASKDLNLQKQQLKTIRGETVAKHIAQTTGAEVLVCGVFDGQEEVLHAPNEFIPIEKQEIFSKYVAMILYNLFSN